MKFLNKGKFERSKVAPTPLDRVLEVVIAVLAMITIIFSVYFYCHLPAEIPIHFDLNFEPTSFGPKIKILFVTLVMTLVVLVLWLSTLFPGLVNLPVKRTPEKEIPQQRILCRLCHVTAIWVVLLFLVIVLGMASSLLGVDYSVWKFPTLFCVIGFIGTITFYSIKIRME